MITLHFHLQPQYKYELFHIYFTTPNMSQHVKTNRNMFATNNVTICWVEMLRSFGRGFMSFYASITQGSVLIQPCDFRLNTS